MAPNNPYGAVCLPDSLEVVLGQPENENQIWEFVLLGQ
jgi:hypothetical protein